MNPILITVVILGAAVVLLLSGRLRADLIAILVMLALGLTGVITVQQAFSGFSRSAVITIIAIFILAEGLERSGATEVLGGGLLRLANGGEVQLVAVTALFGALLSLFMNNIAAAILMPAVMGAARKIRINPARLLIPLAFGTILGGMATLFTTNNIIASGLLRDQSLAGFGVLDFLPVGLPIILLGVGFIALIGMRLLPERYPPGHRLEIQSVEDSLSEVYRLKERLVRARVPVSSAMAGKTLGSSSLRESYHLNLIAIERNGQGLIMPAVDTVFLPNDQLLLAGRPEAVSQGNISPALILIPDPKEAEPRLESNDIELVEAVLTPRSNLINQTLRQAHFREKYEMNVIGIWREGRPIRTALSDLTLEFGDALLMLGPRSRIHLLRSEKDLVVLHENGRQVPKSRKKIWLAIGILGISVILSSIFNAYIGEIMLAGGLAMVLTGVLSMDEGYRAVDWKTVFIIAGMLPIGIALSNSGAAAALSQWIAAVTGGTSPKLLLAGLMLITVLLTQIMNGAAVIAILIPLGISIAQQSGIDPRSLTMGIALAASMAFITPFGHPVNLLVMGPAGYRMKDYFKVGFPLTILLLGLIYFLLPVFWPL